MRRKYILISDFSLNTYVQVKGEDVLIRFEGGLKSSAFKKNGFYVTSNKSIQEALENSTNFNKKYEEDKNYNKEGRKQEQLSKENAPLTNPELEPSGTELNTEVPSPEVKLIELDADNKQIAIEQLVTALPKLATVIKPSITNSSLQKLANENGYTFPHLQIT